MPIDLGVALLPNAEVRNLIIELSEDLRAQHATSYALGGDYHPHLSLYQSTFRSCEDLGDAMRQLKNKEQYLRAADIKLRNLIMWPSNFVTFQCYTTEGLRKLHEAVLKLASRVRLTDVPSIWKRNNVIFPPEKEENIRRYGYPDALELFDPHFTIGRATDTEFGGERIVAGLTELARPYLDHSHVPTEIVVYELGVDGACLNPRRF